MVDGDNIDYLSDEPGEIDDGEVRPLDRAESISLKDGSYSASQSPSTENHFSRPSSAVKSNKAEDLVVGAEAISSDEESGAEEGEVGSVPSSPKSPKEPPSKKQKIEPRDDLEDGEIESDSEEEKDDTLIVSPPHSSSFDRANRATNRPKVEYPRQNKRKRPEDCGVCKFYLRGNCTWDTKCKYDHPLGNQRLHWLSQLGIPDPDISSGSTRPRKNDGGKHRRSGSQSSKDRSPHSRNANRRSNSDKSQPQKSPRASPISSDGSRSPSPKRRRPSPEAVNISTDEDSRPPSRHRSRSPRRKLRSSSSESSRSRSNSPFNKTKADTTLGALLRKRRLESQQNSETQPILPLDISDSDEEVNAPPMNRAAAVKHFFNKDSEDEPAVYKQSGKRPSPLPSPTPQSISSSDDERDEIFNSPRSRRSESPGSPVLAST